jgi:UDP-N-acetylglucosamine transferase subunit ALG13
MTKINKIGALKEKQRGKLRILVAPLDWGLGHATRCIPVIYELLSQGAGVWIAGEGAQKAILTQEFPDLPFLDLQGYRVKYARTPAGLLRRMLFQAPRLLMTIRYENEWLKNATDQYGFDAVISDNRFGLYHSSIRSVFITHQLTIKSPMGKWSERYLQKNNYKYINRFTECWVPDQENEKNLAGILSHPAKLPAIPVHYIGPLSRLNKTSAIEKKGHLFISLSGPEPQRTLLENIIINDIGHYNGTATIVRGLPTSISVIPSTNDIRFYNHLPSEEYNRQIEQAEYVISRSGYSTVMDLAALGKKSILIPTPGQTEQEYLADYLLQQKTAYCIPQKEFALKKALEAATKFHYAPIAGIALHGLKTAVSELMSELKKSNPC